MKLKLTRGDLTIPSETDKAANFMADLFKNRGYVADTGQSVSWEEMYTAISPKSRANDAVASPDIYPLMASTLQVILREPLDPIMNISNLFTRIVSKGLTTQVLAGAIGGAVYAADVPESGAYPENFFQIGGGMQTAHVGKSGIQCSFTDEALRYSTWDIMSMNVKLMYQALVRHKERKASAFLSTLGLRLFDNADPTNSLFGVMTGRGLDMAANGVPTVDDIFRGISHMTEEGFPPDTLLISPLTYFMFLQDPTLRNMMMQGSGGSYFQSYSGEAGPRDPWSNGAMGSRGMSMGNRIVPYGAATGETPTGIVGREHGMTAQMIIPGYGGPANGLRIITSPLVAFDASTNLFDMYLIKSGDVGLLLVDEELTQVEWRTEVNETTVVRLRERYGYALSNEGMGVGVFKNCKLGRNFWDGTIKAYTLNVDEEISPTADVGI